MDWFLSLFIGGGIAHTVLVLSLVIATGVLLGKIKIAGISIGVTWILFVGILAGHFGMSIDSDILHFIKEFGLILFVFSIGLQVGPGFFSSFKDGGMKMVGCAIAVVVLGALTTYIIHLITGTPMTTMVGIMSGAVTNTPGLGAAQQAYTDVAGVNDPTIASGYAVAYPLGVVGIILSLIIIRYITRVNFDTENKMLAAIQTEKINVIRISVEFTNISLNGYTITQIRELINRSFVISRILHQDGTITIADGTSKLQVGEKLCIICSPDDNEAIVAFLGRCIEMNNDDWETLKEKNAQLVSRRIIITKPEINGKKFSDLRIRTKYGINITRVNRAGVDLIPYQGMELQVGDALWLLVMKVRLKRLQTY